ncbi:MAG: hypothetical protein FD180_4500 [Planctomycetota bacterium]|nr:MAG: hypothetical protein FD180_4500 [Planctomycetota bacterium]
MTDETGPDALLRMELPVLDTSLMGEYDRLMKSCLVDWQTSADSDPRLGPSRRRHDIQVRQCLENLTEENAQEIRTRLKGVHAALDAAESEAKALRTPEELQVEERSRVMLLSHGTEFQKLAERAWMQAQERHPELAGEWKRKCSSKFRTADDFTVGAMMLAMTQARQHMDIARSRPGGPGRVE